MYTVMYGWRLAFVPLEPVAFVVNVWVCAPAESVAYERVPWLSLFKNAGLPPPMLSGAIKDTPCVCVPLLSVVPPCVWLTTIASFEPPVSSAVSNRGSAALKPTGTRPAPNAVQVPKPSSVPGLVLLVALM